MLRIPHFLDNRLTDGGEVVSLMRIMWRLLSHCLATGVFTEPFPSNGCLCWLHNSSADIPQYDLWALKFYVDVKLAQRINSTRWITISERKKKKSNWFRASSAFALLPIVLDSLPPARQKLRAPLCLAVPQWFNLFPFPGARCQPKSRSHATTGVTCDDVTRLIHNAWRIILHTEALIQRKSTLRSLGHLTHAIRLHYEDEPVNAVLRNNLLFRDM
jgi:hypothetical protein